MTGFNDGIVVGFSGAREGVSVSTDVSVTRRIDDCTLRELVEGD